MLLQHVQQEHNCIGDAFRAIQYGDAEVMLAGGTEKLYLSDRSAGFTSTDSTFYFYRSDEGIQSI